MVLCSLSIMHMDPVCKGRSVGLNLLTVIELLHSLDYKVGGGGCVICFSFLNSHINCLCGNRIYSSAGILQ